MAYENDHDAYKKARDEALKKPKSRDDKRLALEAIGERPQAPLQPIFATEEPTYEGFVKLLRVGQLSIGLFTDEGGRLIGGHGMNAENQLKTASGLSELWDGKRVSRVRCVDDMFMLFGRRVSLHVMAQPAVAQLWLGQPMLREQGFLSRCLVAWPSTTAGTRDYCEIDLSDDVAVLDGGVDLLSVIEVVGERRMDIG